MMSSICMTFLWHQSSSSFPLPLFLEIFIYLYYRRISNIGGYACISTGKKYAPISEGALINEGRFFASICASVITNSGCGS